MMITPQGFWLTELGYHWQKLMQRVIDPQLYSALSAQTNGRALAKMVEVNIPNHMAQAFAETWESYLADWKGQPEVNQVLLMAESEDMTALAIPALLQQAWPWLPRAVRRMAITPVEFIQVRVVVLPVPLYTRTLNALIKGQMPHDWSPEPGIFDLP